MKNQNSNNPVTLQERVKKAALFSIIGHAIILLLVAVILFVPVFSYTVTEDVNGLSGLVKVSAWEKYIHGTDISNPTGEFDDAIVMDGNNLSGKYTYTDKGNFSYFNEIVRALDTITSVSPELLESEQTEADALQIVTLVSNVLFMAIALIFVILIIVFAVRTILKDVKALQDPDAGIESRKYLIAHPLPVKTTATGMKISNGISKYVAPFVAFLVVDIAFQAWMNKQNASGSISGIIAFVSRFATHISGVSLGIIAVAVLVIGGIVVFVCLKKMNNEITNELQE